MNSMESDSFTIHRPSLRSAVDALNADTTSATEIVGENGGAGEDGGIE